jgi:hypothetical protein
MKTRLTSYLLLFVFLAVALCVTGCGGGGGGGSDPSGSGIINSSGSPSGDQATASNATANEDPKGNTYDTPEPATISMLVVGVAGVGSYLFFRRRHRSKTGPTDRI